MPHTPGPWSLDASNEFGAFEIWAGEGRTMICDRAEWNHRTSESLANARLIAAAPDLLAACEAAEKSLLSDNPLDFKVGLNAVRAAIAKAKGE